MYKWRDEISHENKQNGGSGLQFERINLEEPKKVIHREIEYDGGLALEKLMIAKNT